MGITEQMKGKTKHPPSGGFSASLLVDGEADIAINSKPELLSVPGVEVVGPLPGDMAFTVIYDAGVQSGAAQADAAKALVEIFDVAGSAGGIQGEGLRSGVIARVRRNYLDFSRRLSYVRRVGPHCSRPATLRHIAQALRFVRSSDRRLLAICVYPSKLWIRLADVPGRRRPPGQLPCSQALSQLRMEMRNDLCLQGRTRRTSLQTEPVLRDGYGLPGISRHQRGSGIRFRAVADVRPHASAPARAAAATRTDDHLLEDIGLTRRRPNAPDASASGSNAASGCHTTIITGFSISVLNAPMSSAPSAPSTAR